MHCGYDCFPRLTQASPSPGWGLLCGPVVPSHVVQCGVVSHQSWFKHVCSLLCLLHLFSFTVIYCGFSVPALPHSLPRAVRAWRADAVQVWTVCNTAKAYVGELDLVSNCSCQSLRLKEQVTSAVVALGEGCCETWAKPLREKSSFQ